MLRRGVTSSPAAVLVVMVTVVAALLRFEVPALDVLSYSAYLVGGVALPGVFTWRALLARLHDGHHGPTWFEDLSLGTIFGFTLQLPFFLLGVVLTLPWLVFVPLAAVLLLTATPAGRGVWALPTRALDRRAAWALTALLVYGTAWLCWNIFVLRPTGVGAARGTNVDETFHQALVADVALRFPPEIPFLLGTRLDYHWFVHAQVAAARSITGIDTLELLRLLVPTLMLLLTTLGLAAVALRLAGRTVAAVVAPTLLVAGGYHMMGPGYSTFVFYEPYLTPRFLSSPSQSYGVMISLPAVMLLIEVLRPRRSAPVGVWVALIVSLVGLAGAKATFLPVFLCGALGLWLLEVARTRRVPRRASALVALLAAVFTFAQVVIFGGQSGAMDLAPLRTVESALMSEGLPVTPGNAALMTSALLTGWLLYGVGAVGLRRRLLDPRAVWLMVSVAAGITVPFLLYRSGLSQLWFSRTVAELVVLLSAWGIACLLPGPLTARRALRYGAVGLATGIAVFAGSTAVERLQGTASATSTSLLVTVVTPLAILLVWSLLRLVARLVPRVRRPPLVAVVAVLVCLGLGNVVADLADAEVPDARTLPTHALFATGGIRAGEYVAEHSPVDDVVATNIHCREPDTPYCDNRSFWVAAYTERRVVIQGWGYTSLTNLASDQQGRSSALPAPNPLRLAVNDAAFLRPSLGTLRRLVTSYGVDWLFVGRTYEADLRGLIRLAEGTDHLTLAYANRGYVVFAVDDEGLSRD